MIDDAVQCWVSVGTDGKGKGTKTREKRTEGTYLDRKLAGAYFSNASVLSDHRVAVGRCVGHCLSGSDRRIRSVERPQAMGNEEENYGGEGARQGERQKKGKRGTRW